MEVLSYLFANSERPVSREELLSSVWGYARELDIETRTVDIHIAKLRRKIEVDPKSPRHLLTVRGAGYRLIVD
jgi:two-component system response regulator RegX3